MKKIELKNILNKKLGCKIQHTGWPCGTCFFSMSQKLTNQDWQTLLLFRGDYKKSDLTNLPENQEKTIQKIVEIAIA